MKEAGMAPARVPTECWLRWFLMLARSGNPSSLPQPEIRLHVTRRWFKQNLMYRAGDRSIFGDAHTCDQAPLKSQM